jgi:hypothetical protein
MPDWAWIIVVGVAFFGAAAAFAAWASKEDDRG